MQSCRRHVHLSTINIHCGEGYGRQHQLQPPKKMIHCGVENDASKTWDAFPEAGSVMDFLHCYLDLGHHFIINIRKKNCAAPPAT